MAIAMAESRVTQNLGRHAQQAILGLLALATPGLAADWPTYRADAARSGWSPDSLPARLHLRWRHQGPAPRPAWPDSSRITFDFAHQPLIVNGDVIFASTADDSVTVLEADSGRPRWRFFAEAPVRFAPAAWRDRIFVASDDGVLYALSIADGSLLWKHRAGPDDRMCLGNERMISRWPARGGPVVHGGVVYYAAGIWPSDGVFVCALDATTGAAVWINDKTGALLMPQPHGGAEARSGVAPQGYLAVAGTRLIVPTGRAVPAAFRLNDGALEYYRLQENGSIGGSRALVASGCVINGGCFLEAATGALAARAGRGVFCATPEGVLQFTGETLATYRWNDAPPATHRLLLKTREIALQPESAAARRAAAVLPSLPALKNLFLTDIIFKQQDPAVAGQTGLERTLSQARPDIERLGADATSFMAGHIERSCEIIAAADEAVCGAPGAVHVVNVTSGEPRWSHKVDGNAAGLAAAGGLLVVSTTSGAIYCFGDPAVRAPASPARLASDPGQTPADEEPVDFAKAAEEILQKTGAMDGYCIDLGCGMGRLAIELARRSNLRIIGVESDASRIERARRAVVDAGLYGSRITIQKGVLDCSAFPRYFADLIVSSRRLGDPSAQFDGDALLRIQRPCGGVVCLGSPGGLDVRRRGPLEGAGQWTHQNADPGNSLCSDDTLARGPLEIGWFRDGPIEIPDRHAQGPAPLFADGCLVVEGVHGLCGIDAYNGRTRWVHPLPGILSDWDGVHHDVGVGDAGSNFCLGGGAAYVRTQDRCLKLDLATGRKLAEFRTPCDTGGEDRDWGHIAFAGGVLYGSVLNRAHAVSPRYGNIRLRSESSLFFALDAASGALLWQYRPRHSLRNNAIALAAGKVFLIDRPIAMADRISSPSPKGKHRPVLAPGDHPGGTLLALDARTGTELWRNAEDIFGTQLTASSRHAVLLMHYQAVKHGFFKLPSELGGRIAAFDSSDGRRLWDREAEYKTRPLINDATIYAEGGAWNLHTGAPVPWAFHRSYGCGQIAASRHLMLFRSATLGYLDLTRDAGTENFGGIRPSCWFNAIPAGGLVLVPDGSSKCACSYQAQAWLALQPRE